MSRSFTWRKVLAAPAVIALALSGTLFTATSANAADFAVLAPVDGSTASSRTVEFSGTGTDGWTVNVRGEDGARIPGATAVVVTNGRWTATGTYSEDAAVPQTVLINQVNGGSGSLAQRVSFNLPPQYNFAVTSPTVGEILDSREVVFTGTGTDGSTVNVLDEDGNRIPGTTAAVVTNGRWTTTGTYAEDAAVLQTVYANQVIGGAGRGSQEVTFLLPANAPVLDAPVITRPTEGEKVVGSQVTFEGTGIAGAYVGVVVVRTKDLEEFTNGMSNAAEPAPADPTDPIVVGADGRWTVTVALVPEDYTAIAIQTTEEVPTDFGQISLPSAPVSFSLVAAVAPAGNKPATLAATGIDSAGFAGIAGLLMLGGAALVLNRARRTRSN